MAADKKTTLQAVTPRPVGRPTDYRPEYCEMLIDHMSRGLSYETFGALVDACKQTVYTWEEKFPEFLDAKKKAFTKCQLFWEELGTKHVVNISSKEGPNETLNTGVWVFNMKNRFKWTDRVEVTPRDTKKRELSGLSDEELDELI